MSAKMAWSLLSESLGSFKGRGVNHEGENFTGMFSLNMAVPNKMIALSSSATGDNGEIYHQETSWIGWDLSGKLVMNVASNNHPAVVPHYFDRIEEKEDAKNVVFRFGDVLDRQSFREEITFSVFRDGQVAHHYAWGLPNGDFEPRSGSKMSKTV